MVNQWYLWDIPFFLFLSVGVNSYKKKSRITLSVDVRILDSVFLTPYENHSNNRYSFIHPKISTPGNYIFIVF